MEANLYTQIIDPFIPTRGPVINHEKDFKRLWHVSFNTKKYDVESEAQKCKDTFTAIFESFLSRLPEYFAESSAKLRE